MFPWKQSGERIDTLPALCLVVFFRNPMPLRRSMADGRCELCIAPAVRCGQALQHAQSERNVSGFEWMGEGMAIGFLDGLF